MSDYKLYVWPGTLSDYTNGVAFAIARSKKEAIRNILTEYDRTKIAYSKKNISLRRYSNFGLLATRAKSVFSKELHNIKPVVYRVDRPMGRFQGGGG